MSWECPKPITIYSLRKGLIKTLSIGLAYMLFGKGLGRENMLESGAFLRSRPDLDRPDLQIHTVLAIMQDHGKVAIQKDGFTFHVCQLRPESRGRVGRSRPIRWTIRRSSRTTSRRRKTAAPCARACG